MPSLRVYRATDDFAREVAIRIKRTGMVLLGFAIIAAGDDQLYPRRPFALAFSGPDKRTLYVPQSGAIGPDGKAWTTPETIRNTAMTIYRLPLLAKGYEGRPK